MRTVTLGLIATLLSTTSAFAQNAYITNQGNNTVSVIDTKQDRVIATIPVGTNPYGVAVTPDGTKAYIATQSGVYIINTKKNKISKSIPAIPAYHIISNPDGEYVYVTFYDNNYKDYIGVIATYNDTLVATIDPRLLLNTTYAAPEGMVVSPDGKKLYFHATLDYYNSSNNLVYGDFVITVDTSTLKLLNIFSIGEWNGGSNQMITNADGSLLYLGMGFMNNGSVVLEIDPVKETYTSVWGADFGLALASNGKTLYATEGVDPMYNLCEAVSIDITTNKVSNDCIVYNYDGIPADAEKESSTKKGISLAGTKLYVADYYFSQVSVVDTATGKLITRIPVGKNPVSLGEFIQPTPQKVAKK